MQSKQFAWSPKYSRAVEEKSFWKILLTLKRHHAKPNQKIILWAETMGINDIAAIQITWINTKLREAQQQLREIKEKATQLREAHLRELLQITQAGEEDKAHEKCLKILIRAHQKQYSYRRIQNILKPQQRGGLSYIITPEGIEPHEYPYKPEQINDWSMIHDHKLVQQFLLQRNVKHFGQAHGTPFTIPPLTALDWGACSPTAQQLLHGEIQQSMLTTNHYVNAVLTHIAKKETITRN
jgi:hypothetical protein